MEQNMSELKNRETERDLLRKKISYGDLNNYPKSGKSSPADEKLSILYKVFKGKEKNNNLKRHASSTQIYNKITTEPISQ